MLPEALSAVALGTLAVAGVAKLAEPKNTVGALRATGASVGPSLVRLLGAMEFVAAVGALAAGGPWAAVAALLYLSFSLFTLYALRNNLPIQSCGCFGKVDTPPSRVHVGFNLVSASALAWVVVSGTTPVPWDGTTTEAVLYLGFTGLGVFASLLLLTRLPQLTKLIKAT